MEYYYPYLHGSQITTCETIEIERHAAREAFAGICDELKLGVTLIFYIENIADILHARKNAVHNTTTRPDNAVLAGLSTGGKILLPIMKTSKQLANKEKSSEKRLSLMKQARDGNKRHGSLFFPLPPYYERRCVVYRGKQFYSIWY